MERRKDNKGRVLKEGEYQRKNGTYEYRWKTPYGETRQVYAKTLDLLREQEAKVTKDCLDGIRADEANITVNDLYDRWIQLKRGLKDNSYRLYQWLYNMYVRPEFGKSKVKQVKRSDIRAFYNHLSEVKGLKVSSVDRVHTVLHQVFQFGVEDEYIRYNPADEALRELKKAKNHELERRKALTADEQNLFEAYLRDTPRYRRWYPVFTVMMWTGMRVGEICGLRWQDIDLKEGTISVNHTLVYYNKGPDRGCGYAINTTKTKSGERIIPMTEKVRAAFEEERNRQQELEIECTDTVDGYTDFIFINRFGSVQQQGSLNRAIRRITRDCNFEIMDQHKGAEEPLTLPPFSCHSLRHSFATRMCEAGMNIKAMQDILGHSDIKTTMDIYAEATKDLKKKEMENLAAHFA